ncbi:TonB-dependent receptor domain-containing protein [Oleiharenicola lentus]|uniref:TonB-dependent receptor domain-containing protein n=1 Tax=Oleiharenicola lentus TaxID=2508720 RepID=UPI003F67A15D
MNNSSVSNLRKPLALLGAGLSLFAANAAFAQTTTTTTTPAGTVTTKEKEETVALEKFQVTGSRLTGAAADGPLSVSLYKMDDIQNSGYSNIGELMRKKLPQFGGGVGTINEAFGNGGSGQATISLRNLPLSRTLFLVNGRRTNADINLIPQSAVDSIEVLNDGASAIYGSDAVAGVLNIKLKRNYEGGEFKARYANTTDTDVGEKRFGLTWGGKLNGNTSLTATIEHYERNLLMHYERDVSVPAGDSVSGTSNPGLFTPVSTAAQRLAANATQAGDAGHVAGVTNTNVLVPLRWFVNTSGGALTSASQVPAGFVPNAFITASSALSVAQRNALRDAEENTRNAALGSSAIVQYGPNKVILPGVNAGFPFGYYTYAFRPQETTAMAFAVETEISESLRFFADLNIGRNESSNALAPSPLSGRSVATTNYWYNTVFPAATAAGNSLGFGYRPIELGSRITYNTFDQAALTAGLKGDIQDKWNYEVAVMRDVLKVTSVQTGGVLSGAYNTALAASTQAAAFNPFIFTPFLTTNAPANTTLLAALGGSAQSVSRYTTDQVDANVAGEVFDLPAGAIKVSVGAEWRKETTDERPDSNLINGTVFPFNIVSPFAAKREIVSYYAETDFPVIKNLNVQVAGRVEEYSDAGGTGLKPRFSFSWKPVGDQLNIRGSYSQGFVVPGVSALTASAPSQSFTELFNPVTGVRTQATAGSIFIGNPALKPAESDSWLFGVVYSPKAIKGLSLGLNYYKIEEDGIPFTSDQYIVNEWFAAGPSNASNPFGPTAAPSAQNPLGAQVEMNVDGSLRQVRNVGPINSGKRITDGFDAFVSYYQDTSVGRFTVETAFTLVTSFEQENFPGAGTIDYLGRYWPSGSALGNYGFPELKGSFNVAWEKSRYSASVGWNYVDGYKEAGNADKKIPSYDTFDVRLGYNIPWIEAKLTLGVNNITDEQPPFIATSFETQSDRAITDIRGRILYVELSKKF